MRLLQMPNSLLSPVPRIGNIIPINKLTLLTALPGSGKSYSLMKFLNLNNVTPVLFNLDNDSNLQQFSAYHFTDTSYVQAIFNDEVLDLKDTVIIFDTYIRLLDALNLKNTEDNQKYVANKLESLTEQYQCTIIVIGHPEDYVGKSSIFKDNPYLVRNAFEHIHIDKILSTKKHSVPEYRLYVNKGRGICGSRIHEDWLREPATNPLTGLII